MRTVHLFEGDNDMALYIDGKLVYHYDHIYVGEVLHELAKAGFFKLEQRNADDYVGRLIDEGKRIEFPENVEDVK